MNDLIPGARVEGKVNYHGQDIYARGVDPIATSRIEDLMIELRQDFTIIIVTHNMQQAARVADRTAFFTALADEGTGNRTGLLVEYDLTRQIFRSPRDKRTEDYISGRFG